MRLLRVTDDVWALFPDLVLGVVVVEGIWNAGENPEVVGALRNEEERVAREFAGIQISEDPHVRPWREAYRAFGAKPKEHLSSIENLIRRAARAQPLPHINTLVDIYNTVSLRHLVPVGGEDLDQVRGDVLLTRAGESEPAVQLLGESDPRPPKPGEVIYRDDLGAICRRFNWKEAKRTKLTERTGNALLVIEALTPSTANDAERAIAALAFLIQKYGGGTVKTARIDAARREVALFGSN